MYSEQGRYVINYIYIYIYACGNLRFLRYTLVWDSLLSSNKQFITLGHCEVWSHFTCTLYFHSPSARDHTDVTREIFRHIYADQRNKSYIHIRVRGNLVVLWYSLVWGLLCSPNKIFKDGSAIETIPFPKVEIG